MEQGFPRRCCHAERRKILCSSAAWPARVSNVERMDILPRPIPLNHYLRSPAAVNILRSAAALYMSLRRYGCPALDQVRAHVLRLVAGLGRGGPTDKDVMTRWTSWTKRA